MLKGRLIAEFVKSSEWGLKDFGLDGAFDSAKDIGRGLVDSAKDIGGGLVDKAVEGLTEVGSALSKDVDKEEIQGALTDSMADIFKPGNTRNIAEDIATGQSPEQVINRYNPSRGSEVNNEIGKRIGGSISKAIGGSDNLSLPTSIAVNGFNFGTLGKVLSGTAGGMQDRGGWGDKQVLGMQPPAVEGGQV